ncbi:hypothetical protein [Priestia taiwanensis]|uniref:Uncharacterized protein n=1 Tax=Priestia taiwanensis TaxID=1347902 RepID=A0A917AW56_9BACI|nr:hypothetical protein [Priestia taiwanensis]MBM7364494.1 hypothetical protein [Priestia taiwanensis]GGE81049.1 hypothetical protein GCM10007140_33250 [Priestia taiwanensis]
MAKKSSNSKAQTIQEKQNNNQFANQTGYGDKKLEGPNRPST